MTVAEVKDQLPRVPVRIGRKVLWARMSGRCNPFASVSVSYVENARPRDHLRGEPWSTWHFSWEAVAHAATSGQPLQP